MTTWQELVKRFALEPHPEGGFYRETYRSAETIPTEGLPPRFPSARAFSTGILFLLRQGDCSRLHRIRQDELWHFYLGGPLRLSMLSPEGAVREIVLGADLDADHCVQYAVPAGWWFGARPCPGAAWSLVGCTVAPGFCFEDFEMADRASLTRAFPAAASLIAALTPETSEP